MKKKGGLITLVVIVLIVVLLFAAYQWFRFPAALRNLSDESLGEAQVNELKEEMKAKEDKKVLVTYFSYSGTTKGVAEVISSEIGADLFEIAPKEGYSSLYLQSNMEIRGGKRPELSSPVDNIEEYDIIFIGYPIWFHATPAPINSFLESYDLTGKLVIPFCTSGGSDIEETMPTFLDSCEGLAVYGQRRISGSSQIGSWLTELDLNLSGHSSGLAQEEELKSEILSQAEQEMLTGEETVPEEIQDAGHTVAELENLPTYEYMQQEIEVYNEGQKIYGIAYIPDTGTEKVPLAICAHGLGGSYRSNIAYAEQLAMHGIAAYCFDFRGGGGSRSDGDTTEMSVMTEVSDLEDTIQIVYAV